MRLSDISKNVSYKDIHDPKLLDEYIDIKMGYGDPEAPIWFVGMEEGGGNSVAEIHRRIKIWAKRGKPAFDDMSEFHERLFPGRDLGNLAQTWGGIAKIYHGLTGGFDPADKDRLRNFIRSSLGSKTTKNTCLIEIMPLPAPNRGKWPYPEYSDNTNLKTRKSYEAAYKLARIQKIKDLAKAFRPEFVIFYSIGYAPEAKQISGGLEFKDVQLSKKNKRLMLAKRDETIFVVMPHFTSHGMSNDLYMEIAKAIQNFSNKN